jgi:hypothetical protein
VDFGALFHVLRRQWIALVVGLLLTVAGTYVMVKDGPTEYQSTVQMTMLNGPKINATVGIDGNPYLGYNQTLSIDVDLLTRNLMSPEALAELKALGVTGSVTAEIAPNATGPFMELLVTGKTKAQAASSMNTLISFSEQSWLQLQQQANAPADSIVALQLIAPPGAPTLAKKQKFELVGATLFLGLVCTLLLAAAVDAVRRRRTRVVVAPRPPRTFREDPTDVFPAFSDDDWPAGPHEAPEREEVIEPVSQTAAAVTAATAVTAAAAETETGDEAVNGSKDTTRVASAAKTK